MLKMSWNSITKKYILQALIISACIVLIILYATVDPAKTLFPKCPFLLITGLECPGCGSQRALHCLFNGDIVNAFNYNQLLIIMIPYIGTCAYLELLGGKKRFPKTRKILMGKEACFIILGVFIAFFLLRNFVF